jgi:hypothetical protein
VRFWRHYFTARGQPGRCPLDAELSVPTRGYADLLREWAAYGATDEADRERQSGLERILGLPLRLQALETRVAEAGQEVANCSEQPAGPTALPAVGTILVVQADGTGVPWCSRPSRRRLGASARGKSAPTRRRPS